MSNVAVRANGEREALVIVDDTRVRWNRRRHGLHEWRCDACPGLDYCRHIAAACRALTEPRE